MNRELEAGALVRHQRRPGVWRILGLVDDRATIEPFDDLAAGSFHAAEAYAIVSPVQVLSRLLPGRSSSPGRAVMMDYCSPLRWASKVNPVPSAGFQTVPSASLTRKSLHLNTPTPSAPCMVQVVVFSSPDAT